MGNPCRPSSQSVMSAGGRFRSRLYPTAAPASPSLLTDGARGHAAERAIRDPGRGGSTAAALNDYQREAARRLAEGESARSVARLLGVSHVTVAKLRVA